MSVFAWRTWELKDGILHSTGVTSKWSPGINEAKCLAADYTYMPVEEHGAPHVGCTCGYWAFKTPARLLREFGQSRYGYYLDTPSSNGKARRRVYGVVELAGKMVELELDRSAWRSAKIGKSPAAIRNAVAASKGDRPAWQSTYGPSKRGKR